MAVTCTMHGETRLRCRPALGHAPRVRRLRRENRRCAASRWIRGSTCDTLKICRQGVDSTQGAQSNAQADISTQPPPPCKEARVPGAHEDQGGSRRIEPPPRVRPQAGLGQRGLPRLTAGCFGAAEALRIRSASPLRVGFLRIFMNALPQPAGRQSLAGARLCKHADYERAYAAGRRRQSASMSWFLAPQAPRTGGPRIGITAGKALGKAHDRNRIKRRMREALRRHVDLFPQGFDLIFHPRRGLLTIDFRKLETEIVRILEQANSEAARMAARETAGRNV